MTETTKEIFEKYQIRKTKAQKSAFIDYAVKKAEQLGYSAKVEKGALGVRNIVIGDPDRAKVIFGAHYDTCPILPFPNFITPKSIPIYVLYQLLLTLFVFAVPALFVVVLGVGVTLGLEMIGTDPSVFLDFIPVLLFLCLYLSLIILLFGPANKHTANDNTSGVTTILDIMADLHPQLRDSVAFVLFDNEELGLLGSSAFVKAHRNSRQKCLMVNFDCVSDGDHALFVMRKGALKYKSLIDEAFAGGPLTMETASGAVIYPSDQSNFNMGVGVASLRRGLFNILYLSRIHTARDTIYKEENIEFFKSGAIKLVSLLDNKEQE